MTLHERWKQTFDNKTLYARDLMMPTRLRYSNEEQAKKVHHVHDCGCSPGPEKYSSEPFHPNFSASERTFLLP